MNYELKIIISELEKMITIKELKKSMPKLGLVDLEILFLGINGNGDFNERNIEDSALKRLGVGRILDSLASLKDRKLIDLNKDGSFSITSLAKHYLWNDKIPLWINILRILEIKSFSIKEISSFLRKTEKEIVDEIENLRKNQLVLMSPQRMDSKIIKMFEILPEGIEKLETVEKEGFEKHGLEEKIKPDNQILSIVSIVIKEINDSEITPEKKEKITFKLNQIKEKLQNQLL